MFLTMEYFSNSYICRYYCLFYHIQKLNRKEYLKFYCILCNMDFINPIFLSNDMNIKSYKYHCGKCMQINYRVL